MGRKYLSLVLIALTLCGVNLQILPAQTAADNSPERIKLERLKTKVYRFGLGEKARVSVRLKNGRRIKGYISRTIEDSFDVIGSKTGEITTIPYRDVAQVKKQGRSKGAKIAIGAGITVGVVVLVLTLPGKKPLGSFCPLGCGPF